MRRIIKSICLALCIVALFSGCISIMDVDEEPVDSVRNDFYANVSEPEDEGVTTVPQCAEETTASEDYLVMNAVLKNIEADSIQYYDCYGDSRYAVICKDGKYGLIDYDGNICLPIEYASIYDARLMNEIVLYVKDDYDNHYLLDETGKLNEDHGGPGGGVEPVIYWYDNDYVSFEPLEGIVLRKGNENRFRSDPGIDLRTWSRDSVIPVQQIEGTEMLNEWAQQVKLISPLYGLLDMNTGQMVSEFVYEDFDNHNGFKDGLLAVKKQGKWGFVDTSGKLVIDCIYDSVSEGYGRNVNAAVNGYIAVLQDGLWGLIDTQGNSVLETVYQGISQVNQDGMVWLNEGETWSLYQLA